MRRAAAAVAMLASCNSPPAMPDAVVDAPAVAASFPGCAPQIGVACTGHLCWMNPRPMEDSIRALGGSGCDMWMAGYGLYRMNGDTVTGVASKQNSYRAVVVFPHEVWVTGGTTQRFDGSAWQTMDPEPAYTIWGTAPDDMWIAHIFDVSHWNGEALRRYDTELGQASVERVLWGTAPDDVRTASYYSSIYHFDGAHWTPEALPIGTWVHALWADSRDDWYAVARGPTQAEIWQLVGGAWTRVYAEDTYNTFTSIWGSGSDDIWVAGSLLDHVVHFDGKAWTPVALPVRGAPPVIRAIRGSGRSDVLFAGDNYLARWDGTQIVAMHDEIELSPDEVRWAGMYGIALDDIWMVADRGTTAHWDGVHWQLGRLARVPVVTTAVTGTSASDVWIAGAVATGDAPSMRVWHREGDAWLARDLGASGTLSSIYAAAADDVWAAGDGGAIFHYDGAWTRTPTPTTTPLSGVWGTARDAWAVGGSNSGGIVLHWNGSAWSTVLVPTYDRYTCVWGRASNDVYIGSEFGRMLHFDGKRVTSLAVPASGPIRTIGGTTSRMWFTGLGYVAFNHGTGIRVMFAPSETWFAAAFPSATDGWIAGSHGAILRYRP